MAYEKINFRVRRDGPLWTGEIQLPIGPGALAPTALPGLPMGIRPTTGQSIAVTAKGSSKSDALHKAAGIAEQIASNPLVQAALPPGAGAAVSALKLLGKSGAAEGMKKLVGDGAKRIASALKFW